MFPAILSRRENKPEQSIEGNGFVHFDAFAQNTVAGPQRCNMEGCAATWKTWTTYAVFYGME